MLSVKTLSAIFFGFLILAGAVVSLAQEMETTTIDGVEFHLVPEDWVVNYAVNRTTQYLAAKGVTISDDYLSIPIYGMEDQILYYFVVFFKKDNIADTFEELYLQQYEKIQDVVQSYDDYLKGKITKSEYVDKAYSAFDSMLMSDYYEAGKFSRCYELGPIGIPSMGIPKYNFWFSETYLWNKYGVKPEFVCFRDTNELGVCEEFKVGDENILISTDPLSDYVEYSMKNECHTASGFRRKSSELSKSEIENNIKKWDDYKDLHGFNEIYNNPGEIILPYYSDYRQNYDIPDDPGGYGSCTWTACSNFLSWTNYIGYVLDDSDDSGWISYGGLDSNIFYDQYWGNQIQRRLWYDSGYDSAPDNLEIVRGALIDLLKECDYQHSPADTWTFTAYSDYPDSGDYQDTYQWSLINSELAGLNDENASIPFWCGIPKNYAEDFDQNGHAVAIVGCSYYSGIRHIFVSWGDGPPTDYHEVIWWGDNNDPDYTPTYEHNFVLLLPHPKGDPGIFCTLAYFLGVADANNVELGFSCDIPPDPSFQGFQLSRANNKSGPWILIHSFSSTEWSNIRYTDTPPTNEKFYYMLSEIGGDSWVFEVNTDGGADEDDYLTYCSDSDVEGGLNQPLPPECPGTLPPFICNGQPGGPPRPDPPSNADALDNPNDYGGAIKLTWTPAQGPYITNQKVFRSRFMT